MHKDSEGEGPYPDKLTDRRTEEHLEKQEKKRNQKKHCSDYEE